MERKILILLVLVALWLAACTGLAASPVASPEATGEPAATLAPAEPQLPPATEPAAPTAPAQTEAPATSDPNQPVSSEDSPPAGTEGPSPLEPLPNEDEMIRGEVFIDASDILMLESFPVQIMLNLKGALPTPCHHLRAEVAEPDEQNRIQVEVYSLAEPETICIQVLEPFETNLNLGSYDSGTYTIWVNGGQVGEFTV